MVVQQAHNLFGVGSSPTGSTSLLLRMSRRS